MFEIKNIFPTTIYTQENFINEQDCLDALQLFSSVDAHEHLAFDGSAISSHDRQSDILDRHLDLKQKIQKSINLYTSITGYREVKITSSWINKQYPGSVLKEHIHSNSLISGAVYLKADEQSSDLVFQNPNPYSFFIDVNFSTDSNVSFHTIKPKTGMILIFPSWLKHGSDNKPNLSEERIVLSFNTQ
jgi:uncharacterized protein (TIGR02466 family)